MIKIIKVVHEERIIHRDIKPDNYLMGQTESTKNTLYMIDFGLAKCYKSSDGEHIPFRDGKNLTGTARYASLNTHIGYEQSRRDDLESIGIMLIYFIKRYLSWLISQQDFCYFYHLQRSINRKWCKAVFQKLK